MFSRAAVIGILIISCGDDITGPFGPESNNCSTAQVDTVFALHPDALNLVVGSADQVWADWRLDCYPMSGPPLLPSAELDWVIRDPTVATLLEAIPFGYPDEPTRGISPQAPGRTFLVVQARGFVDSVAVSVPDTVVMGDVTFLAAGGDASCAVTENDIAFCWGGGSGSVLGDPWADPAIGTCWGAPCSPMPVPRKTDARSVQVGGSHVCSLDASGSASCWGDNFALQLGVSDSRPLFDPVRVSGGKTFTNLSLGWSHTCGLTAVGAAYCWGDHDAGRLGTNRRTAPISTPELVAGDHQWVSLDVGNERTCGATDVGHLYCWGVLGPTNVALPGAEICSRFDSKGGQIQVQCSYVPLRMPLDPGLTADSIFVQVSGRCARTSVGSVFCNDLERNVYTGIVGLDPLAVISGGENHTCGLTTAGVAWCWGSNGAGQLGDRGNGYREFPVDVVNGHTFTQIAVGGRHSCGLTADRDVWCWGANRVGQAGTSILDEPWEPLKVHGQD